MMKLFQSISVLLTLIGLFATFKAFADPAPTVPTNLIIKTMKGNMAFRWKPEQPGTFVMEYGTLNKLNVTQSFANPSTMITYSVALNDKAQDTIGVRARSTRGQETVSLHYAIQTNW
jgi:hypothetical protein